MEAFALFKSHNTTTPDRNLSFSDLRQMAVHPVNVPKKSAAALAPQLSGHKTKAEVISFDQLSALWIDIDTGNRQLIELKHDLLSAGIESFVIYASKSSVITDKRWRVLIEVSEAIPCKPWLDIQEALQQLFHGDSSAVRLQQILYEPNRGQHYEHLPVEGKPFNELPKAIADRIELIIAERKAIHKKISNTITSKPTNGFSIQSINDALDLVMLLEQYGYIQKGRKWLSPNSTSGIAGLIAFNDSRWFSHHSGDEKIGLKCEGGTAGDAFDLYTFYEHGGDKTKSLASLVGQLDPAENKRRRFEWAKKHGGSK